MVFFTVVHSAYTHIIRLEGNIRTFDIDKSFSSDDSLCQNKIPSVRVKASKGKKASYHREYLARYLRCGG